MKSQVVYNREHYTCVANDVIKGKQVLTLQEARLIRLIITQVARDDKDLKTYVTKISELAEFLGIPKNNLYRDMKRFFTKALSLTLSIQTSNPKQPWKIIQWLQLAEYDGTGNITIMLSEQLKPYVLELDKWFTKYQMKDILSMDSFYAIRFYELLKCDEGVTRQLRDYHEYSIEYLRTFFCCEEKYDKISDFKRKVIDISIKEINEKSDILIEVEYIKKGREIYSVRVYVRPNYKRRLPQ